VHSQLLLLLSEIYVAKIFKLINDCNNKYTNEGRRNGASVGLYRNRSVAFSTGSVAYNLPNHILKTFVRYALLCSVDDESLMRTIFVTPNQPSYRSGGCDCLQCPVNSALKETHPTDKRFCSIDERPRNQLRFGCSCLRKDSFDQTRDSGNCQRRLCRFEGSTAAQPVVLSAKSKLWHYP